MGHFFIRADVLFDVACKKKFLSDIKGIEE